MIQSFIDVRVQLQCHNINRVFYSRVQFVMKTSSLLKCRSHSIEFYFVGGIFTCFATQRWLNRCQLYHLLCVSVCVLSSITKNVYYKYWKFVRKVSICVNIWWLLIELVEPYDEMLKFFKTTTAATTILNNTNSHWSNIYIGNTLNIILVSHRMWFTARSDDYKY